MQRINHRQYRKTNVYPFLNKMYTIFKTKPCVFVLKKMRIQGDYDYIEDEDVISIDFRKELISTLIHEVLHHIHPTWKEQQVKREEHKIMNSVSVQQVKHILKRFVQTL